MTATARLWRDRHGGADVRWDRRSLWAFGEQPLESVAGGYDLLVIDHPLVGRAAEAGALLPLDGWTPIVDSAAIGRSQASYRYSERTYALAIDAACQVAVARPDRLPVPPANWAEMVALAGRTGRVAMPLRPIDVISAVFTLCAHLGAPACSPDRDGFADRTIVIEAVRLLTELARVVPAWCAEANPIAVLDRMVSGTDIDYSPLLYGYADYARPERGEESRTSPRLAFHAFPGVDGRPSTGSCLGGAGLAVSATTEHPEAAVAYARFVAEPGIQQGPYLAAGGQPAAASAWTDPRADATTGGFFTATRGTIESAYVRPRHPGFPVFQTAAAGLLTDAVLGRAPITGATFDRLDDMYAASLRWRDGDD